MRRERRGGQCLLHLVHIRAGAHQLAVGEPVLVAVVVLQAQTVERLVRKRERIAQRREVAVDRAEVDVDGLLGAFNMDLGIFASARSRIDDLRAPSLRHLIIVERDRHGIAVADLGVGNTAGSRIRIVRGHIRLNLQRDLGIVQTAVRVLLHVGRAYKRARDVRQTQHTMTGIRRLAVNLYKRPARQLVSRRCVRLLRGLAGDVEGDDVRVNASLEVYPHLGILVPDDLGSLLCGIDSMRDARIFFCVLRKILFRFDRNSPIAVVIRFTDSKAVCNELISQLMLMIGIVGDALDIDLQVKVVRSGHRRALDIDRQSRICDPDLFALYTFVLRIIPELGRENLRMVLRFGVAGMRIIEGTNVRRDVCNRAYNVVSGCSFTVARSLQYLFPKLISRRIIAQSRYPGVFTVVVVRRHYALNSDIGA